MIYEKKHYSIGLAISDRFEASEYAEYMLKEYEITDLSKLKPAHIFHLDDNIRYYAFEGDQVLFDEENETYYHLGNVDVLAPIASDDIIALVDKETGELELI